MEKVDRILKKYPGGRNSIIQILQDIQDEFNYLPPDALARVAQSLRIPLSRIYSIATFFAAFSLVPRGKHCVTVCMGTACHVRGAPTVLERLENKLGIATGQTRQDREFTLESVNCLGACALAPIVVIDGKYHGQTTVKKVDRILEEIK